MILDSISPFAMLYPYFSILIRDSRVSILDGSEFLMFWYFDDNATSSVAVCISVLDFCASELL